MKTPFLRFLALGLMRSLALGQLRALVRLLPLAVLAVLAWPSVSNAQAVGAIRNSASGQCMDVKDHSRSPEALVIQWGCTGTPNQQWRLFPAGDGYFKIQGINSWQCLDVHWFNTDPGMEVVQFNCLDAANQQFELRPQHDGFALVARHSGLCLQMEGWPWATGNKVVQQPCNGEPYQTWQVPLSTVLQSANSGLCMDVDGFSKSWWGPVNQWGCHGDVNQQWDMTPEADGWYSIKSVNSGLCLEVPGALWFNSGAGLHQWGCFPGAWNQQFKIRAQGGGFYLVMRHSNKCVAVGGGSKDQRARLTQEGCDAPSSWLTWNIGTPAAAQGAAATYRAQGFTFLGLSVNWQNGVRICIWPLPCVQLGGSNGYTQTRYPVVLVHGLAGFGSVAAVDYFYGIPNQLRNDGATVYTPSISAFNTNEERGEQLLRILRGLRAAHGHQKFNLIGHSQGGLSARYVAAVDPGLVASVTTVGTPHTGSKTADAIQYARWWGGPWLSQSVAAAAESVGRLVALLSGSPGLPQSGFGALDSLSTNGASWFNLRYPKGRPYWDCGHGPEWVNGQAFYSVGGVSTLTNAFDVSDYALKLSGAPFGGEQNDGLVSRCSSRWGAVIKDDFGWNHLDQINQLFGLRGLWSSDPVAFYRSHVNRLKGSGL